jgi:alpha-N-arabinofuranosidase
MYAQVSSELLKNGDFEFSLESAEFGWTGSSTKAGTMKVSGAVVTKGSASLSLSPTPLNSGSVRNGNLFGVGQAIPAASLVGKTLYFHGWLHAEGTSAALLQVYVLRNSGRMTLQELREEASGAPVRRRDLVIVPEDTAFLIVLCAVEGTSGTARFDDVHLSVGKPTDWPEATGETTATEVLNAEVSVNPSHRLRPIPATLYGTNIEWIWNGNGLWDANVGAPNGSVVALTRKIGPTLYRFPGGTFSDYYDWRDGVGPQDWRGTTESMSGGIVSAHKFGTDEALAFAETTGGNLLVTVNVVTGTPELAADWVRYVNSGRRRVTYWEIGNESYVPGNSSTLTPEEYTRRFLLFSRAMKAVDPEIKVGAIVDQNYTRSIGPFFENWTAYVLQNAASEIDFVAVHAGYAPTIWEDKGWDPRTVYAAFLAAPGLMRGNLERLSARIEELAPGRDIRIAVTEWGPFFDSDRSSRFVDHTKTLGSALFVASALQAFIESPRTDIANLFKLTDAAYMGLIGLRQGTPAAKASALAFELFTRHFGTQLVESTTWSPMYDSPSVGWVDAARTPYVEAIASLDAAGQFLYIIVTNKNFDVSVTCSISINGHTVGHQAEAVTLLGTALDAGTGTELPEVPGYTWARQAEISPRSAFYSSSASEVTLAKSAFDPEGNRFEYVLPPHSVTALRIPIQD